MGIVSMIREEEKTTRTLYECSHARVCDSQIYCDRGYDLSTVSSDEISCADRLTEGIPLAPDVCQDCIDFDCMGPPVPDDEQMWPRRRLTSSKQIER